MRHFFYAILFVLFASYAAQAAMSVELSLVDGTGKAVAKTTTSPNGEFKFDKLTAGKYSIKFTYNKIEYVCNGTKNQPLEVQTAREASSGMATGKRQYQPVIIRKEWEPSSPVMTLKIEGTTISGRLLPTVNK